jgi:hypothetical protein
VLRQKHPHPLPSSEREGEFFSPASPP